MPTFSHSQLEEVLHPVLPKPREWKVTRYEVEVNYETSLPEYIVVTLTDPDKNVMKLKFDNPRVENFGSLKIPDVASIYVANMDSFGWENSGKIAVGEYEEENSILFWASSVEAIA